MSDEREDLKMHCSKLNVQSYELQQNLQKMKMSEEEQFQQLKFMYENVQEMEKKGESLKWKRDKLQLQKQHLEKNNDVIS